MQIEYQNTKDDYLKFYKDHFATQLKKRIIGLIIFPFLIAFMIAGQPFKVRDFFIVFLVTIVVLFFIGFILPFLISLFKLNKSISKDDIYLEKRILSTTDNGIIIQSASKTTQWSWQSINSFSSSENSIQIQLVDKKTFLLPKRFFKSENEVVDFLGIVQTGINKTRGIFNKPFPTITKPNSPPYLLGLLCLIPLIGAFVGLGLLLYGVLKYKDKWLSIIGVAGILWTIIIYSVLFFAWKHASIFKKGFEDVSQMQLNSLVKNIEFYKLSHGQYPDSLKQLLDDDKLAPINDAAQVANFKGNSYYNYKKIGNKYLLFSSGHDGIPNTKDDLFPQIIISDSSKIGLLKYH